MIPFIALAPDFLPLVHFCSVDEILRYISEKFGTTHVGGSSIPMIRAAPFVGQARAKQPTAKNLHDSSSDTALNLTLSNGGHDARRGGGADSSRSRASIPLIGDADDIHMEMENEGEDDETFFQEQIAAQAVARLIAAGHEEDGVAAGLAEVVAHEVAVMLSGSSHLDEPDIDTDASKDKYLLHSIPQKFESMLQSVNCGGDLRCDRKPTSSFVQRVESHGSSATCARSMMESCIAGRGQNQKAQMAAVENFRRGDVNVLVATCIAEEGLVR